MPTIRQGIYQLLSEVEITTKEHGKTHVEPWLSQRLVIDGVCRGLAEDVHTFVVLKCRQVACTTVCGIVGLFWTLLNAGTQGAIIADRGDNLERLRRIFADFLGTLPPQWRGPEHRLITNNRQGMTFANGSVIDLLAAAANPDLGASRALNFMHATECSLWKSLAGVESLQASLARLNPNRLFLYESIANGFNWYYNFCQQAKKDRHMRFIFLGFWSSPSYAIPKSDPDFKTYWDRGTLTEEEIKKVRYVRETYGHAIRPEQIAWWRREAEFRAEEYMLRHYPWTETECFIASGSGFFPAARTLEIGEAIADGPPYKGFKYTFGEEFLSSRIEQTSVKEEVSLKVWEPPQPDGIYVVGCDPSGGGGEDANDHAIEVWRCYADRLVQCAEYCSNKPYTYQLAWVLAHLCGAYKDHICNLEITGIGAGVLPEVRNLRLMAERGMLQSDPGNNILNIIGCVRWFLYSRPDTFGGAGNVHSWKTNQDNKSQIYTELRDSLLKKKDELEIRSLPLVQQMQAIVVEQGGWIGAGPDTGEGDDRVAAFVLAHHAWVTWRRDALVARNYTWASVNEKPKLNPEELMSQIISRNWQAINRKASVRREKF